MERKSSLWTKKRRKLFEGILQRYNLRVMQYDVLSAEREWAPDRVAGGISLAVLLTRSVGIFVQDGRGTVAEDDLLGIRPCSSRAWSGGVAAPFVLAAGDAPLHTADCR